MRQLGMPSSPITMPAAKAIICRQETPQYIQADSNLARMTLSNV